MIMSRAKPVKGSVLVGTRRRIDPGIRRWWHLPPISRISESVPGDLDLIGGQFYKHGIISYWLFWAIGTRSDQDSQQHAAGKETYHVKERW